MTRLVEDALAIERENSNDRIVEKWNYLFPDDEMGVHQGSALSAFCANLILSEFDRELNQRGITMVRYIDDFLILGPNHRSVNKAWASGVRILKELGLDAHEPIPSGDKASQGEVASGFDYLSFSFNRTQVGLSRSAKTSLLTNIDRELGNARSSIQGAVKNQRRAEPKFVQALFDLDLKIRGWGDSFGDVDRRLDFDYLDREIVVRVKRFISWYAKRTKDFEPKEKMRSLGVALLADTPKRMISAKV